MISVRKLLLAVFFGSLAVPAAPVAACPPDAACATVAGACCCGPEAGGCCGMSAVPETPEILSVAPSSSSQSTVIALLRPASLSTDRAPSAHHPLSPQTPVVARHHGGDPGSRAPPAA